MANVNQARGFYPLVTDKMGLQKIEVASTYATRIGQHDPIIGVAGGYAERAAADSGVAILGVAMLFTDTSGKPLVYIPASTGGYIWYIPAQNNIFGVQADSGTALDVASVNATADIVAGDCNTTTGVSIFELDSSNVGTGNTCRILGLVQRVDNSWAEHADLRVKFVENAYDDATSI